MRSMLFRRSPGALLALIALSFPAVAQAAKPDVDLSAQRRSGSQVAATPSDSPALLGQYGDWGAYSGTNGDRKVCFALSKPVSAETDPPNRPRDQPYIFVSMRPAENVKNEISVIVGYPHKTDTDATVEIGSAKFAMYTQNDGAWIKNAAEETQMVDAMRKGSDLIVKGISGRGTETTDRYSLKGITQALERAAQECR